MEVKCLYWVLVICLLIGAEVESKSKRKKSKNGNSVSGDKHAGNKLKNQKALLWNSPDVTAHLEKIWNGITIQPDELNHARSIVQQLVSQIEPRVYNNAFDMTFGKFAIVGSTSEGLKVLEPDDFDVQVPVYFTKVTVSESEVPGYVYIYSNDCDDWKVCDKHNKGRISPKAVISHMQSIIQTVVNKLDVPPSVKKYRLGTKGPTALIYVDYKGIKGQEKSLKVDFVPIVTITNTKENIVAKGYVSVDTGEYNSHVWRQSFAQKEMDKISQLKKYNQCHLKVLMVMKAFCKLETPIKALSSYQLKTILFHMSDDQSLNWDCKNFGVLIEKYLQLLRDYTKRKNLPNFFINEANIFHDVSPDTLKNIYGRVKKILQDTRIFFKAFGKVEKFKASVLKDEL